MKKLYDEAQANLVSRLAKTIRAGRSNTFTAFQQRVVSAQLREGQALIAQRLAGDMGPLTIEAQERALKGLIGDVKKLHRAFTGANITLPVEEAATFAGVISNRASSILRSNKKSFAGYGARIVGKVEKQLSLAMLEAKPTSEVIDEVAASIDGEWWQGERIVRTEMAYAYSASARDGIAESARQVPELMMRWEENCDDEGRPLDGRVCVDSIAIHGQVAPPGGVFTMPETAPFPDARNRTKVPDELAGLSWSFPPNRPNDRACISPWMQDWGVPGWTYNNGQRKWLVR
jgi:hypothetical protein